MRKVLIVNAVPVNNGDAALVLTLYWALKQRGLEVSIATHRYKQVQAFYPEVEFVKDVLDYSIIKNTRLFKYLLIPFFLIFISHYREADTIIGAPGGYINSYYGISEKLYVMFICKLLGKKNAIYSQSIGPLNRMDSNMLSLFMRFIDKLFVRDLISFDIVNKLTGCTGKIRLTEDAAFLLAPSFSDIKREKKVAVSVRDWSFDNRNRERYYSLIAELVRRCTRHGYAVDFISTCQGVPNYIDDSSVADKIVRKYLCGTDSITVNYKRYALMEFREKLREYDLVIGTRLHMCILSMLNGTPAFNISYEAKGKECYTYLGLSEISVDYNDELDKVVLAFEHFMNNIKPIQRHIKERILTSHDLAVMHFEQFCAEMW